MICKQGEYSICNTSKKSPAAHLLQAVPVIHLQYFFTQFHPGLIQSMTSV